MIGSVPKPYPKGGDGLGEAQSPTRQEQAAQQQPRRQPAVLSRRLTHFTTGLDRMGVAVGALAGGCLLVFATITLLSMYGGLIPLVPPDFPTETARWIAGAVFELGCIAAFWLCVIGLVHFVLDVWMPGGNNGA